MKCGFCNNDYEASYNKWKSRLQIIKRGHKSYCSEECRLSSRGFSARQEVQCQQCGGSFYKDSARINKTKNNFCSSSCAGTYTNTHKTTGYRRSKLEVWLESSLSELYPQLEIHFNRKDAIESELDFYFPSLKLAFELNGIFHYEPIYGEDQLKKIKNNDERKFAACLERGIELCIIDSSQQKYFKPSTSQKYLEIIVCIIQKKLANTANSSLVGQDEIEGKRIELLQAESKSAALPLC